MPENKNDEISDDSNAEVLSSEDVIEEITSEENEQEKSVEEIQA